MIVTQPKKNRQVRAHTFVADEITPIAAFRALANVRPGAAFLFESAPAPQASSRYSVIGLGVRGDLRIASGACLLSIDGKVAKPTGAGPLESARQLLAATRPPEHDVARTPFLGAFGAAAFEFAGCLERLPTLPRLDDPMPDLHLIVPETIVVFDHFTHHATIATIGDAQGDVREDGDVRLALSHAWTSLLGNGVRASSPPRTTAVPGPLPYLRAVERAKEAIDAGEAFQVVLSQRWTAPLSIAPLDAYRALRAINPSPYMFYLDLGWGPLFGSSPEMLARLDGRRARVRPLAGTRPRGRNIDEDRRLARDLKRDPKERAEHIMLVDLGRNDLGRVCRFGTVRPTELFEVERYSHVMHLMSEVTGTLRDECDAFDLFAAAFPAGTVSGAPKIRAMELIAELEGVRRGYYAGSVGHFGFDGSMEACITLRSAHAYGGVLHIAAGAGIVADSTPAREDDECAAKARAVLEAIATCSNC